jgi:ribosomal protein L11 methyltransferase
VCDKMESQSPFPASKKEIWKGKGVPMTKWEEIRVTIPKEAREAVANFLMERGSSGIILEDDEEKEEFEILRAYFPPAHVIRSQTLSRYLGAIRKFFPGISPTDMHMRRIPDEDWMVRWRAFFKPSRAGNRIVVKPPWINLRRRGVIAIDIEPGMAFGTGTHPTTRLCLRALEKVFTSAFHLPRKVLDVGTGSGILSIAAVKLGARHVVGIDIDQRAIDNARRNIRLNGLRGKIRMRNAAISQIEGQFDVVVANIDANAIEEMKHNLAGRVAPDGVLILSGLLVEEVELLRRLFLKLYFAPVEVSTEEDWGCVVLKRALGDSCRASTSKLPNGEGRG